MRTKVLRKLRTDKFRERPVAAGRDDGMLVIGEPKADPARYAELPAARREAQAVAQVLPGARLLDQPDALQAVNALLEQPLRIVHISGHGEFREDGTGGVVLSNDTVLGPGEIEAMRLVPELVFVNCCFIGQIHPDPEVPRNALGARAEVRRRRRRGVDPHRRALRGRRRLGGRGHAGETFAPRFYQRLLDGDRFIDAVGAARRPPGRPTRRQHLGRVPVLRRS